MRPGQIAGIMGLAALAISTPGASKDNLDQALSRSIYVPVQLKVCEHLKGSILYRGEEPLTELPGTHVFQFTFFPRLKRIVPELERVRVQGRDGEENVRTEMVVTPATVYVGDKKIDLDLDKEMRELRRHIDVRHEPVIITLRCAHACGKTPSEDVALR